MTNLTRAAKVDDLDGAALRVTQENVLRFQVAVDDVQLRRGQVEQRRAQLLRKLARQVEGDPAEVGVTQQVVQVVAQQLKHKAQVVAEHKVSLQTHCKRERKGGRVEKSPCKCSEN